MMTFEQVRVAITERMVSWTGIPSDQITYENAPKPFDPSGMDIWARLTAIPEQSSTPELGCRVCIRRSGTMAVQLFVPSNSGIGKITQAATSLAEHFELYQEGHMQFYSAEMITTGDDGSGWYQVNVNIRYQTI